MDKPKIPYSIVHWAQSSGQHLKVAIRGKSHLRNAGDRATEPLLATAIHWPTEGFDVP
jgi:hypothetical protein